MKFFTSILCALALFFSAPSKADAKASIGAVAAYPEIAGVYVSGFPAENISLDGWLTLSTVDFGVSGHIPVKHTFKSRHSIVLTGLGGFTHNLVGAFPDQSYHVVVAGGYGYQTVHGWDLRVQLGTEIYGAEPVAGLHGHVMIGHMF